MIWTNILVPLSGEDGDEGRLAVAKALAEPCNATITAVFASISPTSLFNWANEAGGPTDIAIAALERTADAGQARCHDLLAALDYPKKTFKSVCSNDWSDLRATSRLADVFVWDRLALQGHGLFGPVFQQILLDEERPALVANAPPIVGGTLAIAWDGGREASRAVRRAIPLLRKADQVVVLTAPHAMARPCTGSRAISYLADHGVRAVSQALGGRDEAGSMILDAVHDLGARVLIAGAFGHPRLQRFIFGGTTQILLGAPPTVALFLSH